MLIVIPTAATQFGPGLDGITSQFISTLGEPNTLTYGQTFRVADPNFTQFNGFSMWVQPTGANPTILKGYIATWTGTRAGSILATSASSVSVAPGQPMTKVSFTDLSVDLDPSAQYVFFVSAAEVQNGQPDAARTAAAADSSYADGNFVFLNHNTLGDLLTTTWSTISLDNEFIVLMSHANAMPQLQSGTRVSMLETAPRGSVIYRATAVDADAAQAREFSLLGNDASAFVIDPVTGVITLNTQADFETKPQYQLELRVMDDGGAYDSKVLTVDVTNVTWAVSLSPATLTENAAVGTSLRVGTLSIIEDDTGGQASTLSLEGADASRFELRNGRDLYYIGTSPDHETTPRFNLVVASTANSVTYRQAITVDVTNLNDNAPTGSVTIAGTPTQGQVLSATQSLADRDGMGSVSYQWFADGVAIAGRTAASWPLTQAEVGKKISVVASYVDGSGARESVSSAATAAVADVNDAMTGGVAIDGVLRQGSELTAVSTMADLDGLGPLSYQWLADGTAIAGAVGARFTPGQAEVGKILSVQVKATDGQGAVDSASAVGAVAVSNVNDAPTGSVQIEGHAVAGQVLTAAPQLADADGLGPLRIQWLADGLPILGARGADLLTGPELVGRHLAVQVSYLDGFGASEQVRSAGVALQATDHTVYGTGADDTLTGTSGNDQLNGLAGNDRLSGGAGDDQLDGDGGLDTAAYPLPRAQAQLTAHGSAWVVTTAAEGTDALVGVERLQFADTWVALDLAGNAGVAAKLLGALFSPTALHNTALVGTALRLVDQGLSVEVLATQGLSLRLSQSGVAHPTAADAIALLYQNVLDRAPTASELAEALTQFTDSAATLGSLVVAWAESSANQAHIDLVGLSSTGLAYLPG